MWNVLLALVLGALVGSWYKEREYGSLILIAFPLSVLTSIILLISSGITLAPIVSVLLVLTAITVIASLFDSRVTPIASVLAVLDLVFIGIDYIGQILIFIIITIMTAVAVKYFKERM